MVVKVYISGISGNKEVSLVVVTLTTAVPLSVMRPTAAAGCSTNWRPVDFRVLQVKKRQQRVTMILDSKSITYDLVDITEPGKEDEKTYMQTNSKSKDGSKNALPPQIFNDDVYCGVSICWNVVNIVPKHQE